MALLIDNQQSRHPIAIRELKKKVQIILKAMVASEVELSIVLVDDKRIAELNEHFLKHMGPTNVISFPMRGGEFSHLNPNLLGDVVISADTCAAEAQYGRLTFTQRLDQLIVHGILHLFGYDHINNPKKARLMARKSAELLSLIEGPTTTEPRMRKRLVRTKNSP